MKTQIKSWKNCAEKDLVSVTEEIKKTLQEKLAVIILTGSIGAGKTTFTQYFVSDQKVLSPSYSIINEAGCVVHADFYRLESKSDISYLEIPLYLKGKKFFIVEWGIEYLSELVRECADYSFTFYELIFKLTDDQVSSNRDIVFYQLKI